MVAPTVNVLPTAADLAEGVRASVGPVSVARLLVSCVVFNENMTAPMAAIRNRTGISDLRRAGVGVGDSVASGAFDAVCSDGSVYVGVFSMSLLVKSFFMLSIHPYCNLFPEIRY